MLFCLSLGSLAIAVEVPAPARTPDIQEGDPHKPLAPLVLKLEDAADASRISYELARNFLSEEQWKARVAETRRKFADWEKDNVGDIGSYLNYRLPAIAFSVSSGKMDRLKEGAAFLALYREFEQPLPQAVTSFARDNLTSLNALLGAFTWEKASEYVKNRQWLKDRRSAQQNTTRQK